MDTGGSRLDHLASGLAELVERAFTLGTAPHIGEAAKRGRKRTARAGDDGVDVVGVACHRDHRARRIAMSNRSRQVQHIVAGRS